MMKISILTIFMGAFSLASLNAQSIEYCGHDRAMHQMDSLYSGALKSWDKAYHHLIEQSNLQRRGKRYDTVYTIRVVFHVLYNQANENIPDSLLISQIEALNRDFRRKNADTSRTRSVFKPFARDARIQFVLADKDPQGNATNGIVRKFTSVSSFNDGLSLPDGVKFSSQGGDDAWDTDKYLNIWVADISYQNADALLGYAYPPLNHPFWSSSQAPSPDYQGVVLHYKIVGINNPLAKSSSAPLNGMLYGRTGVHEVGHFLGLRHIWGDAQNPSNGCSVDDFIDDTPNQARNSNFTCLFSQNTCNRSVAGDLPDMIENYMDYSSEECQNMFTEKQILVMRSTLESYRISLPYQKEVIVTITSNIQDKMYWHAQRQAITLELTNESLQSQPVIQIYDASGRCVKSFEPITEVDTEYPLPDLAPAVYIAKLVAQNGNVILTTKWFLSQ